MEKVKRFYQDIYKRRICNQFDHVMPIVGDEGYGKVDVHRTVDDPLAADQR